MIDASHTTKQSGDSIVIDGEEAAAFLRTYLKKYGDIFTIEPVPCPVPLFSDATCLEITLRHCGTTLSGMMIINPDKVLDRDGENLLLAGLTDLMATMTASVRHKQRAASKNN